MDKEKTLKSVKEFIDKYNGILNCFSGWSIPIAVLQGNTAEELIDCYKEYNIMGLDHIAIPFHNSFFKDMGKDETEFHHKFIISRFCELYNINSDEVTDDIWYAIGRIKFVYKYGLFLNNATYIHLLGSHCPYEKCFYSAENIKTMDTGYPVKCALEGYELFKEPHKPNIIIDDFIDKIIYDNEKNLIMSNMKKFRDI